MKSRNRDTDVENKLLVTKVGGNVENWEIGVDIYTLLCMKQITNKHLLYSTGTSTQCSLVTYIERKSKEKRDICILIADSFCCPVETNTTL